MNLRFLFTTMMMSTFLWSIQFIKKKNHLHRSCTYMYLSSMPDHQYNKHEPKYTSINYKEFEFRIITRYYHKSLIERTF